MPKIRIIGRVQLGYDSNFTVDQTELDGLMEALRNGDWDQTLYNYLDRADVSYEDVDQFDLEVDGRLLDPMDLEDEDDFTGNAY